MCENKVLIVGSCLLGVILLIVGIVFCVILVVNVIGFMMVNNKVIEVNNKMFSVILFKKVEGILRYILGLIVSVKIGNDLLIFNNESNNNELVINVFEWYL